jgi:hypothetical protein
MGPAEPDQPSPSPPRRRAGWVIAVTSAVIVVFAAAITAVVLTSRPTNQAGPTSGSQTSDSPAAGGYTGDLRQLLLARPSTARPAKDAISTDGVLSLDQAAQITHPEDQTKVQLVTDGYQRGAIMQWQDADVEVIIRLFQFATPGNAQGYEHSLDQTFAPGYFDQSDVSARLTAGHVYMSNRPLDERGFLASATAVRGNLLMIVTRYQPTSDAGPSTDLAVSQYALLP